MQPDEDTTRRLLFGVSAAPDATPRAQIQPAQPPHTAAAAGSAEAEAEAALRYLEAEWAMRMEAPLSALASLEDTLTHALDVASSRLPFPPPEREQY